MKMKAWRVAELGEPLEVMRQVEADAPSPAPGQLLVRVLTSALNFPDVMLCRGHYQIRPPLPFTPGVEMCGEIAALGEGVEGWKVGERVIGNPVLPDGTFAEYSIMDASDTYPAPAVLGDEAAAALHVAYQTAWFGLHRRARIQPGETLLVHAGAGGVGSAAVQVGKAAGARVIAVVGGAHKAEAAAALGADVVVDRRTDDFVAVVKQATEGRGADVVFDPVGGDAYAGSTKCVAFEGRIVIVGFTSGTIPTAALNHALIKNYSILGLHWGLYRDKDPAQLVAAHAALTALAESGAVAPLIGGRVTFDEVPQALTRVGAGDSVGRLVLVL